MSPAYSNNYEIRAMLFAAVIWLPYRALLSLWGTLGQVNAGFHGYWSTRDLEALYYAGPSPHYFVELIAVAGAVLALMGMLSTGRTPEAKWILLAALGSLALSACCYLLEVNVLRSEYPYVPDDELFSAPKILSVLILDVEVGAIAYICWKWRRSWLLEHRSQPIAFDADAPPPPPPKPPRKPRGPKLIVAGCIVWTTLLAFGGTLLIPSSELRAGKDRDASAEFRFGNVSKAKSPLQWIEAARQAAYHREHRGEIAGAISCRLEIIRLDDELYGPESAESNRDVESLAGLLTRDGRFAEAEPWVRRSLIYREKQGSSPWSLIEKRQSLAAVLVPLGKLDEARDLFEKAIAAYVSGRNYRGGSKRVKLPVDLETAYRELLSKMGETPAAVQAQLDKVTMPPP